MKLFNNFLLVYCYVYYIAKTLIIRGIVMSEYGYLTDQDKEDIADNVKLGFYEKHWADKALYVAIHTVIYYLINISITKML